MIISDICIHFWIFIHMNTHKFQDTEYTHVNQVCSGQASSQISSHGTLFFAHCIGFLQKIPI